MWLPSAADLIHLEEVLHVVRKRTFPTSRLIMRDGCSLRPWREWRRD